MQRADRSVALGGVAQRLGQGLRVGAEQAARDGVRRQEGQQLEERAGRGAAALGGLDRGLPDGGDAVRVVGVLRPVGEDAPARLAQALAVGRDVDGQLVEVGAGLGEGEREVVEVGGEPLGLGAQGGVGRGADEEGDGVRGRQQVELDRARGAAPEALARGDEDVAGAGRRQVGAQLGGARGVVEDEQPAGRALQPGADRGDQGRLVGRGGVEAQRRGEGGVVGGERGRLLGAQPADQVVVGEVGVGVGQRELRLADAAEAGDGLRLGDGGGAAGGEGVAERLQLGGAADEGAVGLGEVVGGEGEGRLLRRRRGLRSRTRETAARRRLAGAGRRRVEEQLAGFVSALVDRSR